MSGTVRGEEKGAAITEVAFDCTASIAKGRARGMLSQPFGISTRKRGEREGVHGEKNSMLDEKERR